MPRKPAAPRTQSEVIEAALLVVDGAGLDGLTIRGVAGASGVPTMTLYAHFDSKDQLLELMAKEVAARLFAVKERSTWQSSVEELCFHLRATVLAHPGWLALFGRRELPRTSRIHDHVEALMLAAGIPERVASRAVVDASLMALGLAQLQLAFPRARTTVRAGLREVGQNDFDWDRTFATTIARWIAGLEAEAEPSVSARAQASSVAASSAR